MCGRGKLTAPFRVLAKVMAGQTLADEEERLWAKQFEENAEKCSRDDVRPSNEVLVIRQVAGAPKLENVPMIWGFRPEWAGPDWKLDPINARVETAAKSRMFGPAWKSRRCVVVFDAFYEWKKVGKRKERQVLKMPDGQPFALAALWERGKSRSGERVDTCTILTRGPEGVIAEVHDREPIIIPWARVADWVWQSPDPACVLEERRNLELVMASAAEMDVPKTIETQTKLF